MKTLRTDDEQWAKAYAMDLATNLRRSAKTQIEVADLIERHEARFTEICNWLARIEQRLQRLEKWKD